MRYTTQLKCCYHIPKKYIYAYNRNIIEIYTFIFFCTAQPALKQDMRQMLWRGHFANVSETFTQILHILYSTYTIYIKCEFKGKILIYR